MARTRSVALRPAVGAIEAATWLPAEQSWLVLGWTPRRWAETEPPERLFIELSLGTVTGEAVTAFFERDGAPDEAEGFCTILAGASLPQATLTGITIPSRQLHLPLRSSDPAPSPAAIAAQARRLVRRTHGAQHLPLLALLPRPAFDGRDTVSALWPPVHLEFDQVLQVAPDGLALVGWFVDAGHSVAAISVCGTDRRAGIDPQAWLPIARPDIIQQLGRQYGLEDDQVGFVAFAPGVGTSDTGCYVEIETIGGSVAHKPLRALHRPHLGVIKQLLSVARQPALRLKHVFDTVLGPIIGGLNAARGTKAPRSAEHVFGTLPPAPHISVIVTLYGRVDFMEYQLALFSQRPDPAVELIYVLDDPKLTAEAERLAFSCWARFRLPFRLVFLAENLGYAPANNAGLAVARGTYVCLLNSDVFPTGAEGLSWLASLTQHLADDPTLGAVAPLLLFEDGTVQHGGMHYERLPSLAGWAFPIHTRKGEAPEDGGGLAVVQAVTGACVVLRRAEMSALGGFDPDYIIGDFEDADLCERLRAAGLGCAVDRGITLYHLERQSQGDGQPWRANATLYNAWRFNRRWGAALHTRQAHD